MKPPDATWEVIQLSDLGKFEVVFPDRQDENLDVPDEVLAKVFCSLEEQLTVASGLLEDIDTRYFEVPTCYPEREVQGAPRRSKAGRVMKWFVQLIDRLALGGPELLKAHATTWPLTDRFFFRKLKLYAWNKPGAFPATEVSEGVLSLGQEVFWDYRVTRELLFLMSDRWAEFSLEHRGRLLERILAGPSRAAETSDEEFFRNRDGLAARFARYLELKGCEFPQPAREQLNNMITRMSEWNDGSARAIVIERGSVAGWVATDENPLELESLPVTEVLGRAQDIEEREFGTFTERQPFTGLVKTNPRKALRALLLKAVEDEYPQDRWSSMISDIPADAPPRVKLVFLHQLARLPHETIAGLKQVLARWLERNLETTLKVYGLLGWTVYDHIVDGILKGDESSLDSALLEVRRGEEDVQRSRRTMDHAINGPVGMCAQGLLNVLPEELAAGSFIPDEVRIRYERLLAAPGEGADHAVSVACSHLSWLHFVDPAWVVRCFTPMLALKHPFSEPAWNGLLHAGGVPSHQLLGTVKAHLLEIFPWIQQNAWEASLAEIAAAWLGNMRLLQLEASGASGVPATPAVSVAPGGLTRGEMRAALRVMSDETRNHFIWWLGTVGPSEQGGWENLVIPLVTSDWPLERQYRTSESMKAWIGLLDDAGDAFPAVYDAVKGFLVPIETQEHLYFRFIQEMDGRPPISTQFPEATLDLMDRATPQVLSRRQAELPMVLNLVLASKPELISDSRYLRLIDLVERS